MIEDFHFLRPEWLLALVPLLIVAWIWWKKTQSSSGWEEAIDSELLPYLLDMTHKRSNRNLFGALLVGLTLACLAAAGPTWQKLPQNVEQADDTLIILLDLSLSMLAEDVKPSRVSRARQEIVDILRMRQEGQTALIVYAGDAHAVVPLTDDVATIENLLTSLGPDMMPVFGSNPDHALILAHELLENSRSLKGRIVMITDGIDNINDVSQHRSAAYPISILGIGTTEGAPIPLDRLRQPGRFLQTQEGERVIALLDEQRLRDVAALTYGVYTNAEVGDADLDRILSTSLPGEDDTIEVERDFDTWFDQGHWLVILILPLVLFAFRRGVLVCLLLSAGVLIISPTQNVYAESMTDTLSGYWDGLWKNSDQRGHAALRQGEPEKAVTLFEDDTWRSVAQYRAGDYNGAYGGFVGNPSITGRYNQGNALARLGEYESAIERYASVLQEDPAHEDAAFNKDLLERLLEEQQQAQEQQEQDQQSQANNEQSDSEQSNQEEQQDQSEEEQTGEESEENKPQDGEQEEQEQQQEGEQEQSEAQQEEAQRDEKQDALEQWLRRVPDDPGGLLRRKFSHETKQRLRRGEYENRQGEKVW